MWSTTVRTGDAIIVGDVEIKIIGIDRNKGRIGIQVDPNIKITKINANGPKEKDGNTESISRD